MPAKGKTRVTDAQRRKIAAGKAAGKSRARIAAEVGLAETTVSKQLADPRTVTYSLKFKEKHEPRLERMFELTLETMERDLRSNDTAVCATARAQFMRLLPMGDPPLVRVAAVDTSGGDYTLEELLISYRKAGANG